MNKVLTLKSPSGSIILAIPDGKGGLLYKQLNNKPYNGSCENLEIFCCQNSSFDPSLLHLKLEGSSLNLIYNNIPLSTVDLCDVNCSSVACCEDSTTVGYGLRKSGLFTNPPTELNWHMAGLGNSSGGVNPLSWKVPMTLRYSINGGTMNTVNITTLDGSIPMTWDVYNDHLFAEIVHPLYGVIYAYDGAVNHPFLSMAQGAWFKGLANCPTNGKVTLDNYFNEYIIGQYPVWTTLDNGEKIEVSFDEGVTWINTEAGYIYNEEFEPTHLPFKAGVIYRYISSTGAVTAKTTSYAVLECLSNVQV